MHGFEDVGIREFSGHIDLESLVRRDNMEEENLVGKGQGERGPKDEIRVPLAGQNPFFLSLFFFF